MLRDDLNDEQGTPIEPEDVVYIEAKVRILVARDCGAGQRPMTTEEWVRFYMTQAHEVRVNVLGPHIDAVVCERGHVLPADGLVTATGEDAESCEDCDDEAVRQAEDRADG